MNEAWYSKAHVNCNTCEQVRGVVMLLDVAQCIPATQQSWAIDSMVAGIVTNALCVTESETRAIT
jgi:hypothetical protein